jgi:DnaJ-class molecular chaperone
MQQADRLGPNQMPALSAPGNNGLSSASPSVETSTPGMCARCAGTGKTARGTLCPLCNGRRFVRP